mmetsp:Transcript_16205/g.23132  ORF Transcript_16205/g.23132 Transcript_16205/m.23132 type:complete len:101 (+) Transcript_16205:117-419(+)
MMQVINEDNGLIELVVVEPRDSIGTSRPEEESLLRTNNSTSRSVMCTYFGAATTAVFVSILCPESKMWRNNNGTVNKDRMPRGTSNCLLIGPSILLCCLW